MKKIIFLVLIIGSGFTAFSQKQAKPPVQTGALYFSLTAEKNAKTIFITKDYGRAIDHDSLEMADKISAYYKVGQKISKVKEVNYDSYFFSTIKEPTILQDLYSSAFENSIWVSCLDSMDNGNQVVIQVKEITLEDGTKIQHPKLAKENKATYVIKTNPNFPAGGWESKSRHWIGLWKEWFSPRDNSFYALNDDSLALYTTQIVYTIKKKKPEKKK